jgi:hypothetical protein
MYFYASNAYRDINLSRLLNLNDILSIFILFDRGGREVVLSLKLFQKYFLRERILKKGQLLFHMFHVHNYNMYEYVLVRNDHD